MQCFVIFLRAVNVGGTGKLPMSDLKSMCQEIGFKDVQTYIASGNLVFNSPWNAEVTKSKLEMNVRTLAGKLVSVCVRTHDQLVQVTHENPFQHLLPNRNIIIFLDQPPAEDTVLKSTGRKDELIFLGSKEVHVYYGEGMANSKLKIPAASQGTARNLNTVLKLLEMSTPLAHH